MAFKSWRKRAAGVLALGLGVAAPAAAPAQSAKPTHYVGASKPASPYNMNVYHEPVDESSPVVAVPEVKPATGVKELPGLKPASNLVKTKGEHAPAVVDTAPLPPPGTPVPYGQANEFASSYPRGFYAGPGGPTYDAPMKKAHGGGGLFTRLKRAVNPGPTYMPYGPSNFKAEQNFAFGSARQFYAEGYQSPPAPLPLSGPGSLPPGAKVMMMDGQQVIVMPAPANGVPVAAPAVTEPVTTVPVQPTPATVPTPVSGVRYLMPK